MTYLSLFAFALIRKQEISVWYPSTAVCIAFQPCLADLGALTTPHPDIDEESGEETVYPETTGMQMCVGSALVPTVSHVQCDLAMVWVIIS